MSAHGPASNPSIDRPAPVGPSVRKRPSAEHTAALRERFGQRSSVDSDSAITAAGHVASLPGAAPRAVGIIASPAAATALHEAVASEVAGQLRSPPAPSTASSSSNTVAGRAVDAAQAFEEALRRSPAVSTPLPQSWRPLANAIVGDRAVRISSGAASRRALRAAGKVAATSGNVIHLATPLQGMSDAPVLAHELTHVASPSPAPRFYDDDRDSPEERRAELVADVIRRSPVLPRPHAAGASPSLLSAAPAVIRRSLADVPSAFQADDGPSTPGGITAAELVRRYTGGSGNDSTVVRRTSAPTVSNAGMTPSIQRWVDPASFNRPSGDQAGGETIHRSLDTSTNHTIRRAVAGGGEGRVGSAPDDRPPQWDLLNDAVDSSGVQNFVDWIMEQVESRMARELERRGGHYRGDF